jgi:3-methyladenine DNA glycosylase AlkD
MRSVGNLVSYITHRTTAISHLTSFENPIPRRFSGRGDSVSCLMPNPVRPSRPTIKRALASMARPVGDFDPQRYFRGDHNLRFYNIGTKPMRAFARSLYEAHRSEWSVEDAMALADDLIADQYLETKSVGIEVVARFRRSFTPKLLSRWKRWLARNQSTNWATTDAICGLLIGPLLVQYPALAGRLRLWSRDRNMWVRRASIVGLIPLVRGSIALDLLYDVAQTLHSDKEDLIQKAVGWALREAGKADPQRLEQYLLSNGPRIPRTTIRYAIERFPGAKRRALLTATYGARGMVPS